MQLGMVCTKTATNVKVIPMVYMQSYFVITCHHLMICLQFIKQSGLLFSSWHMCCPQPKISWGLPGWEIKMTTKSVWEMEQTLGNPNRLNLCASPSEPADLTALSAFHCAAWLLDPHSFSQINWFRFDVYSTDCCRGMTRLWQIGSFQRSGAQGKLLWCTGESGARILPSAAEAVVVTVVPACRFLANCEKRFWS